MDAALKFEPGRGSTLVGFASLRRVQSVCVVFAILIAIQALGFVVLGTGRSGLSVALCSVLLSSLLALACTLGAFRRAHGVAALFWLLFAAVLIVLFIPTVLQTYHAVFAQTILPDSTLRLLYCLYGAPVLMMLFLPETYRRDRLNSEIFLDLFQVAIVVAMVYSIFFFAPVERMLPADALLRTLSVSNAQSLLLLLAALVRLQFARVPGTRNLLCRLTVFLLVCAVATVIGDWIELRHYLSAVVWFNLGWSIPQVAAGLIALTWVPAADVPSTAKPANFASFLGTNLVLVTMLCCISVLMDHWKHEYGTLLAGVAIAVSLLALTLRLALTQFHQEQEISERKAAQKQLTVSHQKVGHLLDNARRQTSEITQISELGSLLQACASRKEIFRLIPERLRRLFAGASGSISLLTASGKRAESVAEWGVLCPAHQILLPEQCWALRRGCTHAHPGGTSEPRCSHLLGEGASVCIPLIANGDTVGLLIIQNDDVSSPIFDSDADSDAFARRRQLAATVAESIALAIANVNLRESLRLQAIRDPLTGLYNRRYMQEFLDRELHSARRKRRPLSVMMLDLDRFKRYNDNYGHDAGDKALAAVGETLLRCLRAEDVACRYGGEEFALILPECTLHQATVRAEEIRGRLQDYHAQPDGKPAGQTFDPLSISIGVAAFEETTDRVDLLLKCADDALYEAKRAGGNRVVPARPAVALPETDLFDLEPIATA
jgi:diguanylate cyclase (GGDEF)-like protein